MSPHTGESGKFASPEERAATAKKIENICLQELSLKQLKAWLEEDQDAILNKVCKICCFLSFFLCAVVRKSDSIETEFLPSNSTLLSLHSIDPLIPLF